MARLIPIPRVRGGRAASSTTEDLTNPHDDAGLPPIETATGMVKSTLAAKAASLAVSGCLVAGPAALVVAMAGRSVPVAAAPAGPVAVAADPVAGVVGEAASQIVMAALTLTRDAKSPSWMPSAATAAKSLRVTAPAVVSAVRQDDAGAGSRWSVTVAVTTTADGGTPTRWFFMVPIEVDAAGTVHAMSGIAQVPGPSFGSPSDVEYPVRPSDAGLDSAVSGFLSALLTGDGEVSRYVSPGAAITAVVPAPYQDVKVLDIKAESSIDGAAAEGAQQRVLVSATGMASESQEVPVTYALTLTMRAGRWEVSRLDPLPALRAPRTPGASPGSSTSSTSRSTSK